jgi:hypothetical protein
VQRRFDRDAGLRRIYEHDIAGGKWTSMMAQTHIGYTGWQQPDTNVLPATQRLPADARLVSAASPAPLPACDTPAAAHGFVECGGGVAIEAGHYARAVDGDGVHWTTIPHLGRTLSAVAALPATAPDSTPRANGPRLEYPLWLRAAGPVRVRVTVSPSLDFRGGHGLRFGVSLGDEPPRVVTIGLDPTPGSAGFAAWEKAVSDNAYVAISTHAARAGAQTLKLWRIDPGVVFQRVEVDRGTPPCSYLGAPESARR